MVANVALSSRFRWAALSRRELLDEEILVVVGVSSAAGDDDVAEAICGDAAAHVVVATNVE